MVWEVLLKESKNEKSENEKEKNKLCMGGLVECFFLKGPPVENVLKGQESGNVAGRRDQNVGVVWEGIGTRPGVVLTYIGLSIFAEGYQSHFPKKRPTKMRRRACLRIRMCSVAWCERGAGPQFSRDQGAAGNLL